MVQSEVLTGNGLERVRKITRPELEGAVPCPRLLQKQSAECYGPTEVLTDVSPVIIKISPQQALYLFIYLLKIED